MLHVDGYSFKQEMFKSFYLSIKNSLPLKKLRQNIYKLKKFDLDNNYSPHISLCYGNHRIQEKKNWFLIYLNLIKQLKCLKLD